MGAEEEEEDEEVTTTIIMSHELLIITIIPIVEEVLEEEEESDLEEEEVAVEEVEEESVAKIMKRPRTALPPLPVYVLLLAWIAILKAQSDVERRSPFNLDFIMFSFRLLQ